MSALSTNPTHYLTSRPLSCIYEKQRTCVGSAVRGRHRSAARSEQGMSWWGLITTVSSDFVLLAQAPDGEWSEPEQWWLCCSRPGVNIWESPMELCEKGPCGASPILATLPRDQWLLFFFLLWKRCRRTILRQEMTDQGQVLCRAKMRQWDYFENSFKHTTCGYSRGDIFW